MNTTQYGEKVNNSVPPIDQDPDSPPVTSPGYGSGIGAENGQQKDYSGFPKPVMGQFSIYKDKVNVQ